MRANRTAWVLWRIGAFGIGATLITGCQAANEKASAEAAGAPSVAPATLSKDEVAPLDRIDEANFRLTWTLVKEAADGQSGSGELILMAKSPFKPNQEYPHKFKLKGTNVQLGKPEINKADMQVSVERVVVPVSFDVIGPNPTLEGTLAFSVCTAEACLIERKDIRLSVSGSSGPGESKGAVPTTVGATPTATTTSTGGK